MNKNELKHKLQALFDMSSLGNNENTWKQTNELLEEIASVGKNEVDTIEILFILREQLEIGEKILANNRELIKEFQKLNQKLLSFANDIKS
jgi:hypothetical protein